MEDFTLSANCCAICNSATSSKNCPVYTETLVELLLISLPPQEDKTIFCYCTGCSKIVDDLLELQNKLVTIRKCIENKLKEIRNSMLRCPPSKNPILEKFRGNTFSYNKDDLIRISVLQTLPKRKSESAVFEDETEHSTIKVPKLLNKIGKDGTDTQTSYPSSSISPEGCVEQKMHNDTVIKVEAAEYNFGYAEEEPQAFEPWALNESSNSDSEDTPDPLLPTRSVVGHVVGVCPWDEEPPKDCNKTATRRPQRSSKKKHMWPKPRLSLPQLIYMAIKNNVRNERYSTSKQILEYIEDNFPCFEPNTWDGIDSLERFLNQLPCFRPLIRNYACEVEWTVTDTDRQAVQQMASNLRKIDKNSMAFPETLESIIQNTSIFWPDPTKPDDQLMPVKTEIVLYHARPIDSSVARNINHMQRIMATDNSRVLPPKVTLTNLELCILAVANTKNSDGYTNQDEIYDFIKWNFPCFEVNCSLSKNCLRQYLYKPFFKSKFDSNGPRRCTIVQREVAAVLPLLVEKIRYDRAAFKHPEQIETFIHNLCTRDSGQPFQQLLAN